MTYEETEMDRRCECSAWVTASDPPRDPLSLLVADILPNLRTCLDQLAFELASAFLPRSAMTS